MLETLVSQNLNKTPEGKIGDFPTPKPFHTRKVQCLGSDKVKPAAQVRGKFEMPISALVGDMSAESGDFSDSTPPIVRTFDFTRKAFVEFAKFGQGLFQELRRLYFLARVERQIGVHTEIYPYALTCSKIGFGGGIVCNNIEPIGANRVAKDLEIADIAFIVAVVMKRKPAFIELQTFRRGIPFFERKANATFFKEITTLKLRRTIAAFALELRQTTKSVKKAFISDMETDNHSVKGIARYPSPMFMGPLEQLRQVRLQPITPRIFTIDTVIAFLKFQKVIMDITQVVKHIAEAHILWMFAYLIFVGSARAFLFSFSFFHSGSHFTILTPIQWVGRHANGAPPVTGKGAVTLNMSATVILMLYNVFYEMSRKNIGAGIPPNAKALGLLPED